MDQNGIIQLAKKTANTISSSPSDTIKVPFLDQYDQCVSNKEMPIDGWVLYTYYSYCDSVEGPRENPIKDKEVEKYYYVLKRDGALVVYKIGYTINFAGTDHERLDIWKDLQEVAMNFSLPGLYSNGTTKLNDLVDNCSAYALDYKHIKWKTTNRISNSKIDYFSRNIPYREGKDEENGESFSVHKPGGGLVKALNKLMNDRIDSTREEKETSTNHVALNKIIIREESVMENGFFCPKCHSRVKNLYFECEKCGFDLTEDELILISPLSDDSLRRMNEELSRTHTIIEEAKHLLSQPVSEDISEMKAHMKDIKRVCNEVDEILEKRNMS